MDKYKLVPVFPTEEMLEAGHYAMVDGYHPGGIYVDMLAAAPAVQEECLGVGKCIDQGCPAHYAAAPAVQVEPVAWMHSDPGRVDVIHDKVRKLLKDSSDNAGYLHRPLDKSERYTIPLYTASQPAEQHPDDAAVDRFAAAVKAKLAKKRQEGRGGWQSMTAGQLSTLLHENVRKGDPVDVGNLAMMLHQNGQGIVPDVAQLVGALEEIIHPVRFMQERLEEGERLDGMVAVQLAKDASYLRSIAEAALAAYRKGGEL